MILGISDIKKVIKLKKHQVPLLFFTNQYAISSYEEEIFNRMNDKVLWVVWLPYHHFETVTSNQTKAKNSVAAS